MRWFSTSSRMKAGSNFDHWSSVACRLSAGSYCTSSLINFRRAGSMAAVLKPAPAAPLSPSDDAVDAVEPSLAVVDEPDADALESPGLSGLEGSLAAEA